MGNEVQQSGKERQKDKSKRGSLHNVGHDHQTIQDERGAGGDEHRSTKEQEHGGGQETGDRGTGPMVQSEIWWRAATAAAAVVLVVVEGERARETSGTKDKRTRDNRRTPDDRRGEQKTCVESSQQREESGLGPAEKAGDDSLQEWFRRGGCCMQGARRFALGTERVMYELSWVVVSLVCQFVSLHIFVSF